MWSLGYSKHNMKLLKIFSQKKYKSNSEEIAHALLNNFIHCEELYKYSDFNISETQSVEFKNRINIYLKALTLMGVVIKEGYEQKFKKVREYMETFIFHGTKDEYPKKNRKIKKAILKLEELLSNQEQQRYSWPSVWLKTIGIEENNPEKLEQFSLFWIYNFKAVMEILNKFDPR